MIGTTLGDIRHHIESLASPTGSYYLVCSRTGERPVPADGCYFDRRSTARAAATATEQYRTALRRYDPQLPRRDIIVCEQFETVPSAVDAVAATDIAATTDPEPATDPVDRSDDRAATVDFCHTVAGVVFETIADSSHSAVQAAIMDRYLAVAETVAHPDELCLLLIEAIATELDTRLSPAEQAEILRTAACRLSTPTTTPTAAPLEAALDSLQSMSILDGYTVDCQSVRCASTCWELTLTDYPLGNADRIVTLPLVVECFRRLSAVDFRISGVERTATVPPSWRLTLTATADGAGGPLSVVEAGAA
ncbi:DUF7551 domain-containing protein [Halohasta salina]|uniref:DUF7551 domain-containing protein n=1 Tax=Halohasta salina TaxID=2961621 RepID=UPI0020A411C8|nr:hypothetical protein [Halohasta salina]